MTLNSSVAMGAVLGPSAIPTSDRGGESVSARVLAGPEGVWGSDACSSGIDQKNRDNI